MANFSNLVVLKKTIIIFVLFLYSISNTEFRQFLRIPTLIFHYLEFENENNSFSNFIFCHYFGDDNDDSDNHIDNELPFKSSFMSIDTNTIQTIPPLPYKTRIQIVNVQKNCYHIERVLHSPFHSAIWQPPKSLI